ncbi:MAG: twin-arginine translocation signal domain-containing protein, partial [Rhodospirillaceae bacterium]|nr:twin-arginine translocation signal domain-containing protein [Rhodospirillaceae bacterium]
MRKTLDRKLSRRKFLGTSAASGAALAATGTGLSRVSFAAGHTIKIG